MTNDEIIKLADSLGFELDYDKSEIREDASEFDLRYMRFVSKDESLDEPDLRWIWYMEDSDSDNINRGKHIISRLEKKKSIQNFLNY